MSQRIESTNLNPKPDLSDGSDEHDLIRRSLARDDEAFRQIMVRYNRRLYRIARSIVRNDADAEDVIQMPGGCRRRKIDGADRTRLTKFLSREASASLSRLASLHDHARHSEGRYRSCHKPDAGQIPKRSFATSGIRTPRCMTAAK
jgi:hypothetical protein